MFFGKAYEEDVESAMRSAKDSASARRAGEIVQARWLSDDPVPTGEPAEGLKAVGGVVKYRDPALKFDR